MVVGGAGGLYGWRGLLHQNCLLGTGLESNASQCEEKFFFFFCSSAHKMLLFFLKAAARAEGA